MRKIMVFQHVGHEPLGTLNPLLKAAGFRIRYVNFGREPDFVPDLTGYFGLVVLGGPMGVYEADQFPHLKVEMKLIKQALKAEIPVLGICLGSQLLATVLGGKVTKASRWELGWYPFRPTTEGRKDPLFAHYGDGDLVFQLHQDTFTIPSGAVHLGSSDLLPGQAFRYGQSAYGMQFHLEVDQPMIRRWMARDENRILVEQQREQFSFEKIDADTSQYISRSLELSGLTFGKFIEIFNLPGRREFLGSTR